MFVPNARPFGEHIEWIGNSIHWKRRKQASKQTNSIPMLSSGLAFPGIHKFQLLEATQTFGCVWVSACVCGCMCISVFFACTRNLCLCLHAQARTHSYTQTHTCTHAHLYTQWIHTHARTISSAYAYASSSKRTECSFHTLIQYHRRNMA